TGQKRKEAIDFSRSSANAYVTDPHEKSNSGLFGLPVHGINVLSTGVAKHDGLIIGREGKSSTITACSREVLDIGDLLDLAVTDVYPHHRILLAIIQYVDILAVMRPTQPPERAFRKFSPLLRIEIEQEQGLRIRREGGDVPAVWRPARGI